MKPPRKVVCLSLVLLSFPILAAEPFSGVYIHPSEFSDSGVAPEAREALMDAVLDGVQACGITTVIPYATTTSGKAYWPGTVVEMDGEAGWDTLGIFAGKARARGLKVMPSVCVLAAGHDAPAGILKEHPDWALRDGKGSPLGWISPANAEARAWITALVLSLVKHIEPDGIMLDYMRFPSQGGVVLDPAAMAVFDAAAPEKEDGAARKARLQR
ncbi:MAG TPA: family 10 glycosylhydrolase, partial [Candidatus Hydrogenedentes bacterium]|nr:family 10 glycosylhydrolase [Candidatus Hydrogenedentota bacterium]